MIMIMSPKSLGSVGRETTFFKSSQVKKHSVKQAQFLSSNHRVVLPWCAQSMDLIELPVEKS
jgi:hypothetical protein